MTEDDFEKTDALAQFITAKYPNAQMERSKEAGRGLSSYYLNFDNNNYLVLKITDECVMDNQLEEIKKHIESRCFPAMEQNQGMAIVLFSNFHIEIRALG